MNLSNDVEVQSDTKNNRELQIEEKSEAYPIQHNQDILLAEIKELKKSIKKLETDIEDIKFFTPEPQKPMLDKETIGTVGGILLGALVIIGIFF